MDGSIVQLRDHLNDILASANPVWHQNPQAQQALADLAAQLYQRGNELRFLGRAIQNVLARLENEAAHAARDHSEPERTD